MTKYTNRLVSQTTFIIPAQQGGNDLYRDHLRPFGPNNQSLLGWKIEQLLIAFPGANIIVSSSDQKVLKEAEDLSVGSSKRSKSFEDERHIPIGDVIYDVIKDVNSEFVAWVSPVHPFFESVNFKAAFDLLLSKIDKNVDSLLSVNEFKGYVLDHNLNAINFQNDQNKQKRLDVDPLFIMNQALFIIKTEKAKDSRYLIGDCPIKYVVDDVTAHDVGNEASFNEAEKLLAMSYKNKSKEGRYIFLDFDGVIFDSAVEAYTVAVMYEYSIGIDDVEYDSNFATEFLKNRFYIGPAWNYFYLIRYINSNEECSFGEYIPSQPSIDARLWETGFFATRGVLRNNMWDRWLGLNHEYRTTKSMLRLIDNNDRIGILTTKDKATVVDLMRTSGVKRDVEVFDRLDYERHGSKAMFIREFIQARRIEKVIFVDDSLEHLKDCVGMAGVTTLHAKWGYLAPETIEDNQDVVLKKLEEFL